VEFVRICVEYHVLSLVTLGLEFGYTRTLSYIWQYRVELVLDSVTRSPHKYERRAAVVTMTT
jgi:hypothetical protein